MKIVVDLMGGDHAPQAVIAALLTSAAQHPNRGYLAVGLPEVLASQAWPTNVEPVACGSVMAMDEDVRSLMKKKDSSIWMATDLLKQGRADGLISAGSTGAQMAAATLLLGRMSGCSRPAIAMGIPSLEGQKVLLDMGANPDCEPQMLLEFARMGVVYAEMLGISQPRVALLVNGSEPHKGNNLTRAAYTLISESGLNFIGNREGRDLLHGGYDVMVCDGMVGNIAVKSVEGAMSTLMQLLKKELRASATRKLGAALVKQGIRDALSVLDYQEYGGAPLLGVNGVSIICHGSSGERALVNALEVAANCLEQEFIAKLQQALREDTSHGGADS